MPNCGTQAAHALLASSARFLLRSPPALNNQMSPLLPPHHLRPPIVTCKLDKRMWRECATFWHSSARAKRKEQRVFWSASDITAPPPLCAHYTSIKKHPFHFHRYSNSCVKRASFVSSKFKYVKFFYNACTSLYIFKWTRKESINFFVFKF